MAWAHVQSNGNVATTSSTTLAVAYSGAVTAGNLLVCAALWGSTTTCTVADSVNGAWTAIGSGTTVSTATVQLFFKENTAAGTPTVTMTTGSSVTYRNLMLSEYSGLLTTGALDAIPAGTGGSTGTSAAPATSLTPTGANDLVFGATYVQNTAGVGAGFTIRNTTDGNATEDQNVGSPGGTVSVAFTQAPSGVWRAVAASFFTSGQEFLPDADTTTTGWTATPLYSKLNDASDATVVTATLA